MHRSSRLIAIAIAFFFMQMIIPVEVNAETSSGWDTEELIEYDNTGPASYPDIGTDDSGNAISVWTHNDGTNIQIVTNRYIKDKGWGDSDFLTAGGFNSLSPRIAVNGHGNATVVWRYSDGTRYDIVARNYFPGSGWGSGSNLESIDGDVQYPQVDINNNGHAIAVWAQDDGSSNSIYANVYTPGTGWGSAELIETGDEGAYSPQVRLFPDGDAIAVWYQFEGPVRNIRANMYSTTTGWGDDELIETDDTGNAMNQMVDIDDAGNAMVVWRQFDGSIYNVMSNRYTAGSGWGTVKTIESGDGQVQPPIDVAIDNDGNALATWSQYDGTRYDILSNRYTLSEGWGEEEIIDDLDGTSGNNHLKMDAEGNAIAVWRQYNGGFSSIFANRFVKGEGWGEAEVLETHIGSVDVPRVSIDPSGDALVVWYQSDGYRTNIWSNRFIKPDTTPPVLTLSSPENGIEVDVNAVTVAGITEPGADLDINGIKATVKDDGFFSIDVSLFPGENTIIVTSTDTSGNHLMETRTVTYTDPYVDEIASMTDAINDLSSSLSSIMGNISHIEDEIASIKGMLGSMNVTDNSSSIIDELEVLSNELDMAKENLTSLKNRLSAIEGEGNETVDLSGILAMIEDLEDDIDMKGSEIASLEDDVNSLESEMDSMDGSDNEDLKDDIDRLDSLILILGAALVISMIFGIMLFLILIGIVLKRKKGPIEE